MLAHYFKQDHIQDSCYHDSAETHDAAILGGASRGSDEPDYIGSLTMADEPACQLGDDLRMATP